MFSGMSWSGLTGIIGLQAFNLCAKVKKIDSTWSQSLSFFAEVSNSCKANSNEKKYNKLSKKLLNKSYDYYLMYVS